MNEYDDTVSQVFGTASPKPPANPYDVVIKQQAQGTRDEAAASLTGAVKVDPDKYARAVRLARSTGVPADVAERNPAEVEQQHRLNEYDTLLATSPVLARKMADPEFAKLSHDEGGALSGMERAIRGFLSGGGGPAKRRPDNAVVTSAEFADNVRRLQEENPALDVATARTLALVGKSVENVAPLVGNIRGTKPGIGGIVSGLLDAAKRAPQAFDAGLSYIAADILGLDQTQNRARMENLKTREATNTPEFETATGEGLYAGGVSTIQNAPGIALAVVTGNPFIGAASGGVQVSVPAYGKYKERGATAPLAALAALGEGAVEVATEYLPMKSLLSVFGKSGTGAGMQFLKSQMQEQWTEQVATIAQDAIDTAVANPTKTWGQYLAERPDAAYKTFLATLVQTGAITIAHTAAQKMVDSTYTAQAQAAEADGKAKQMQELFDLAAGTKLRERNTDSLASFIQSVADDNDATPSALYVDASTLNETLQQAGVSTEQFAQMVPAVAAQLEAALASGDSVELPIGELTANLAGTGLEKVLLQHLRTTPDGLSQAEGKLATEQAQKELASRAAEAIAESTADQTFAAGAEAVRANIGGQLATANRFTKDVNDAYTSLVTDFYTVQAKRLGITPEDLYARYPLKVVAASTAKRTTTLDQKQDKAQAPRAKSANETIAGFATIVKAEPPERSVAGQQILDMVHPPGKNDTTIRAEVDGREVGYLDLAVREDGKTADVRDVMVRPGYQRQGVATALYEAAKAQGFDVQRSPYQTDEGAALTDSFAQGLLQTDTENFKKWFGDSKVVDAAGKPLVVYHGGRQGTTSFKNPDGKYKTGIFFTSDKDVADAFGKGGRTYAVYLSVKNPFVIDASGEYYASIPRPKEMDDFAVTDTVDSDLIAEWAFGNGYDGVVLENVLEGRGGKVGDVYIASKNTQIKSAVGNNGNFDVTDPNILRQDSVTASIEAAPPVNKYAAKFLAGRQLSALSTEERAQYESLVSDPGLLNQVTPAQALDTNVKMEMPTDPLFAEAVGNTAGAQVTADGLLLDLVRFQKPEQEAARAVRTGVFYLPAKSADARHYRNVKTGYGGSERYAGETLVRRPLFVKGATGGAAPEQAYKQLKGADAFKALESAVFKVITQKGYWGKTQADAVQLTEEFLDQYAPEYTNYAGEILSVSKEGNTLRYALQELAVAVAVREAGYDAVVGYSKKKTGPVISEVFDVREQTFPSNVIPADIHPAFENLNQPASVKQPARGTFSPSQLQITLLQNADLSTFLHEFGHFGLEMMADLAAQPGAPAQVQEDMGKVLEWFGVADLATWRAMPLDQQRPYHEQFARGFEAYLFEGKAPNTALQEVFQRFRDWMVNVYRSLVALDVTLTDEVRGVFDRLVATDQDIADARDNRAYAPLFADAEAAGMTPEAWQAYQNLGAQQTADATDELQTRSLRDMRWLTGARNRALKALQAEAKERRASVEAEVTEEVRQLPVYAVQRWIKGKGLPDGSPAEGAKFSLPELKEVYGEDPAAMWRYLPATLASNNAAVTMSADDIAGVFGYTSGDALLRDIIGSDPEAVRIEGMTDQRMLERYGDVATPEAMARAADVAVHNEARAKFVATELLALQKATNVREKTAAGGTVNVLLRAAKEYAAAVVSRRVIKDLRPDLHAASEARAARQAEQALKKNDLVAAATAKRNQVLSGATTRETYAAMAELEKAKAFFRKVMSGKDDTVGKTRDMDVVNAARAIVAQYGIGQARGKTAIEYLALVKQNDPLLFDALKDGVDAAMANAKPFNLLTVEEARGLRDEIEAMWHLAKRTREMVVGGELVDRKVAEDALLERMQEIGIPDTMPGDTSAVTAQEKRMALLRTVKAAAVRVESWSGAKDGAAPIGPFRKYIWQVVKEAADAYRADKATYLKKYRALLDGIAPALQRGLIEAPELGYTFGKAKDGMGMSELLHAIIHTGNVSNKRKLLLGRKWATENADGTLDTGKWDTFVARMIDEGKITKASYDFAQGVWDLLEETKPLAQRAHRDVFGKYFAEVTADAFVTPFGTYRGGYAPAMADPEIVQDASIRALAEAENENMSFAFPATNKGFTKGRVEYNRPLKLDLRSIGQHIDKVLLFSHMEQPVRDVRKLVGAKGVAYALGRIDPPAIGSIITPWLNRSARQQVETPIVGDGGATRWFGVMRNNAGMAAMFANVANAAQQLTGFSMAAIKVRPKYLLGGMAEWASAPRETANTVAEASAYMANRMQNEIGAMNSAINDILLDPNLYEKTKAWTQRHAYFAQAAVDNVMGPIIWIGARNQALENGATEADAIRLADSAVRETQGSTLPEDVSRIETGNAFVRVFTQFMSYFNMQANLLGGEFAKIQHAGGLKQGAGRALYVTTLGFLAPAIVGEVIMQMFRGGPGDEDKDGEWRDDWLWQVFGLAPLRNATAMVPVIGPLVMGVVNASNSKPYDDRMATSPAISMIEATVRSPFTVYKAIANEGNRQKAVRDVATALSMVTGIPVAGIARPLGYLAGVSGGDIAPTGPADAARGMLTGTPSPDSKR